MNTMLPAQEAAKDRAHTLTHEDVAFTGNDDVLRDISSGVKIAVRRRQSGRFRIFR